MGGILDSDGDQGETDSPQEHDQYEAEISAHSGVFSSTSGVPERPGDQRARTLPFEVRGLPILP